MVCKSTGTPSGGLTWLRPLFGVIGIPVMASFCAQKKECDFEDRAAEPGGEHDCTRSVGMASRELEHGGHTPRLVGKWRIDVLLLSNDSEETNGASASDRSDVGTNVGTALA